MFTMLFPRIELKTEKTGLYSEPRTFDPDGTGYGVELHRTFVAKIIAPGITLLGHVPYMAPDTLKIILHRGVDLFRPYFKHRHPAARKSVLSPGRTGVCLSPVQVIKVEASAGEGFMEANPREFHFSALPLYWCGPEACLSVAVEFQGWAIPCPVRNPDGSNEKVYGITVSSGLREVACFEAREGDAVGWLASEIEEILSSRRVASAVAGHVCRIIDQHKPGQVRAWREA